LMPPPLVNGRLARGATGASAACRRCQMHHYRGDGTSLRRGRSAQEGSLGTTMMRRMIGRYKGFRCARMGRGVKGGVRAVVGQ